MAEESRPASDIRNQPADQKLINEHPELMDASLEGKVPGPQPNPVIPGPRDQLQDQAARTPTPVEPPPAGHPHPTDSTGHPRPAGQHGSAAEKHASQNARREEAQDRNTRHPTTGRKNSR